jgi:hypothetical protein
MYSAATFLAASSSNLKKTLSYCWAGSSAPCVIRDHTFRDLLRDIETVADRGQTQDRDFPIVHA